MQTRSLFSVASLMAASSLVLASFLVQRASSQDQKLDQAKMMEMYAKAAEPSAHHKKLAEKAGKWNVKSTCYMDATPTTGEGTSTFEAVLGGRYVIERSSGEMNGQPFEGMLILGFDNVAGEYVSAWIDTMSTGIMLSYGKPAAPGAPLEMKGEARDVLTPKGRPYRLTTQDISKDEFRVTMYDTIPTGDAMKETKVFDATYTRVKR